MRTCPLTNVANNRSEDKKKTVHLLRLQRINCAAVREQFLKLPLLMIFCHLSATAPQRTPITNQHKKVASNGLFETRFGHKKTQAILF